MGQCRSCKQIAKGTDALKDSRSNATTRRPEHRSTSWLARTDGKRGWSEVAARRWAPRGDSASVSERGLRAWREPARVWPASCAAGGGRSGLPGDALIERVLGCRLGVGLGSSSATAFSQIEGPLAGVILELSCRRSI
jgi:hypothetical protein